MQPLHTPPLPQTGNTVIKKLAGISFAAFALLTLTAFAETSRPNMVLIMCDDLGYGDVQCLNSENGKITPPHIDKIASQGIWIGNRFTRGQGERRFRGCDGDGHG